MYENDSDNFTIDKFQGLEQLVTSRIMLDDVVDKGFEELLRNKDQQIKILVTPQNRLWKD